MRDLRTLWPGTQEENSQPPASGEHSHPGKLQGVFTWPFTLELPQTVELSDSNGKAVASPLPNTVSSFWTAANITYTLQATIKYGSFLHPEHVYAPSNT